MSKYLKIHYFLILSLSFNSSWAKTADQTLVDSAKARTILPFNGVKETDENKTPKDGSFPEETKKDKDKKNAKTYKPTPVGWINFPGGIWSEHGEGKGEGDGDENGDGEGSGNGNGEGNKLEMADNDEPPSASDPSNGNSGNGNNSSGPKPTSGTGGKIKGGSEVLSHWWPICAFVDKGASGIANKELKGVVDEAAACNVAIVLFPVEVDWNETGNDFKKINDATRAGCNLPNDMPGSATALVPWRDTAAKMCNVPKEKDPKTGEVIKWDESVAGCAELNSKSSLSRTDTSSWQSAKGEQLGFASGNVAVSIESPQGWKEGVISHEAIGHSEMGKPNGRRYGKGIGEKYEDDGKTPEIEGPASGPWDQAKGCPVMREKAIPNTLSNAKKYLESDRLVTYDRYQQDYYFPQNFYQVASKKGIFSPQESVPSPGQITVPPNSSYASNPGSGKAKTRSNLDKNFFSKEKKEEPGQRTIAMGGSEKHPEKLPVMKPPEKSTKENLSDSLVAATQDTSSVNMPLNTPGQAVQTEGSKIGWVESEDSRAVSALSGGKSIYTGPITNSANSSTGTGSGNALVWSEGENNTSALSDTSADYSTNLGSMNSSFNSMAGAGGLNGTPGAEIGNGLAGTSMTGGLNGSFFDSMGNPAKNPEEEEETLRRKKKAPEATAETSRRRNPSNLYQDGGAM